MAKSILVVDDDHTNLEVISTILEEEDYEVSVLDSGKACLQYIESNKPDMILLDVMLNDELGTDICSQIKSQPQYADVIIILLSGIKVKPEDYIFGLEIGADDYFNRPFNQKQLLARIKSIFRLKDSIVKSREEEYEPFDRKRTSETAKIYQQELLKEAYPDEFNKIYKEYITILNNAIHQRFYKTAENNSDFIKKLAKELAFLKAGARDVIDIHKEALKYNLNQNSAKKAFLYKEESRIVLLELMGYLLNHYKNMV